MSRNSVHLGHSHRFGTGIVQGGTVMCRLIRRAICLSMASIGVSIGWLAVGCISAAQEPSKGQLLRIGTSGSLALNTGVSESAAIDTLKSFIKDETGFDNDILKQKNWRELSEKMRNGQLDLGVFQGHEFAWAKEKYPELNVLTIAIDVYRNRYAYIVARKDSSVSNVAGLEGQAMAIPSSSEGQLSLFVAHEARQAGKSPESFFSRITQPKNVEDALDDVVDGAVQATVVDRVGLEAYKRRKPGRFQQLKEVAHSAPFPSPVVASFNAKLDSATIDKIVSGLLNANQKDRGQRLLDMFKLTGFERQPPDFDKLLAATRKNYPPPDQEPEIRSQGSGGTTRTSRH
jgi:ABC-type phosphate/phosphonate transport system substrate-binding protein